MALQMTASEVQAFIEEVFSQVHHDFTILDLDEEGITVQLNYDDKHLRPGGTMSGPSMFGLADVAFYMITLAHIGREALTVTTNCSIDFMRKPKAGNLIAKARILKLGKQLSVGDVLIYAEGEENPVARANLTYAIPPKK